MVWAVSLLTMKLIPHRLTGRLYNAYSEFVSIWYRSRSPHRNSALPPDLRIIPLRLNTFRGEPASSEFDWHFTPNHTSSAPFSTEVGSVLHLVLPKLQPGHG